MEQSIKKIIADILKISVVELDDNIDSKEIWDSFKRVEIIFAIEDEFGMTFADDDMKIFITPKDMIERICGR